MRLAFALATAVAASLALSAPPAAAQETVDTCRGFIDSLPATITSPGTWCVRKHLQTAMTGGSAITIATGNVTLDCNGFRVNGLPGGIATNAVGIYAHARVNVTVRGCFTRGFQRGIQVTGGDGTLIEDSGAEHTTEYGIMASGVRSIVRRNRIVDVGGRPGAPWAIGVFLEGEGEVLDNSIAGLYQTSVNGIYAYASPGGVVAGNRIRETLPSGGGVGYGIQISGAGGTIARDNAISGTGDFGIGCSDPTNVAMDNVVTGLFAIGVAEGCAASGNVVAVER